MEANTMETGRTIRPMEEVCYHMQMEMNMRDNGWKTKLMEMELTSTAMERIS